MVNLSDGLEPVQQLLLRWSLVRATADPYSVDEPRCAL